MIKFFVGKVATPISSEITSILCQPMTLILTAGNPERYQHVLTTGLLAPPENTGQSRRAVMLAERAVHLTHRATGPLEFLANDVNAPNSQHHNHKTQIGDNGLPDIQFNLSRFQIIGNNIQRLCLIAA